MASSLFELLHQVSEQLPGCIHTSVVDLETGLALAAVSEGDPLDSAGADAFHSDLYRLSQTAAEDFSSGATPDGIVLTSGKSIFVSQPLEGTGFVWLVVTKRETTVGFTQAIMRKKSSQIAESLQALV